MSAVEEYWKAKESKWRPYWTDLADAAIAEMEAELSDITIERLREKQTELAENGGCPCCLAGDEEGHILGCELSEAEAEMEARAEHDEDNLEGLQHALVRANRQYTQARTVRDALAETWGHEVALRLKAEADLAERDQLISLFKDMWANVTGDQYNELMDRWTARIRGERP